MSEVEQQAVEISSIFNELEPDLVAVLGPSLIRSVCRSVSAGEDTSRIPLVIEGGDNFDLVTALKEAVDIALLIKTTLEVHKLRRELNRDQLTEAASKKGSSLKAVDDSKAKLIIRKVSETLLRLK